MADLDLETSRDTQLSIHEAITQLYALVGARKRSFADYAVTTLVEPKPTDAAPNARVVRLVVRDRPIAALLSKAATTKAAIVSLATNNFGGDAFALCRVLLENMLVLDWLLPTNDELRNMRIDTYILFSSPALVDGLATDHGDLIHSRYNFGALGSR